MDKRPILSYYQERFIRDVLSALGYLVAFVVLLCVSPFLPEGPLYATIWDGLRAVNWGHIF